MKVEINNQISFDFGGNVDDLIINALERAECFLAERGLVEKELEVSVALVSEKEIERLNYQHRQKRESTDVLSFDYGSDVDGDGVSGEIILCPDIIVKNAKKDGTSFKKELSKNTVHGLLHILGYEHGKAMFGLQEQILKEGSKVK